jgi:hypothetical protein
MFVGPSAPFFWHPIGFVTGYCLWSVGLGIRNYDLKPRGTAAEVGEGAIVGSAGDVTYDYTKTNRHVS